MATLQVVLDVASDSQLNGFKLTRERIALKPVSFQMCGPVSDTVGPAHASGKLAYVRVATFNKQTTESAKAAFRQLKADGASRYALPGKLQKAVACLEPFVLMLLLLMTQYLTDELFNCSLYSGCLRLILDSCPLLNGDSPMHSLLESRLCISSFHVSITICSRC